MAVSGDGLTAYVPLGTDFSNTPVNRYFIHKFDLSGSGSYVGVLNSDFGGHPGEGTSIIAVPDGSGDIIMAWPGAVKRFTSTGTTVWTLTQPTPGNNAGYLNVAPGVPGDDFFLAIGYDYDVFTLSSQRYCWYRYDDGTPDNTRNFTPEDGTFEFDSQVAVLSVAVGTPPTPPLPTTPPAVIINSLGCCVAPGGGTPSKSVGPLNDPEGPAWTAACAGSGSVPSAADVTLVESWDY